MFKREVNRQQVSILVTRIPRYTRFTRVLIQFHISAIMISNRIPLFFIVKTKRINKSIERKKEKERKIGLSIVVDYLLINK